ncbi:MAG: hypothetical protein J7K15_12140 [Deltaproteobacteria bacterium]|nr:hypothetical protein [Deltaproteobacteria bacterium]
MSMGTFNKGLDDGVIGFPPNPELYENDRDYYEAYEYYYSLNHEPESSIPEPSRPREEQKI